MSGMMDIQLKSPMHHPQVLESSTKFLSENRFFKAIKGRLHPKTFSEIGYYDLAAPHQVWLMGVSSGQA
jgi:hypothetical protein